MQNTSRILAQTGKTTRDNLIEILAVHGIKNGHTVKVSPPVNGRNLLQLDFPGTETSLLSAKKPCLDIIGRFLPGAKVIPMPSAINQCFRINLSKARRSDDFKELIFLGKSGSFDKSILSEMREEVISDLFENLAFLFGYEYSLAEIGDADPAIPEFTVTYGQSQELKAKVNEFRKQVIDSLRAKFDTPLPFRKSGTGLYDDTFNMLSEYHKRCGLLAV